MTQDIGKKAPESFTTSRKGAGGKGTHPIGADPTVNDPTANPQYPYVHSQAWKDWCELIEYAQDIHNYTLTQMLHRQHPHWHYMHTPRANVSSYHITATPSSVQSPGSPLTASPRGLNPSEDKVPVPADLNVLKWRGWHIELSLYIWKHLAAGLRWIGSKLISIPQV